MRVATRAVASSLAPELLWNAFEAMTSDRPIAAAGRRRRRSRELERHAGTQFDNPDCVGALRRVLQCNPQWAAAPADGGHTLHALEAS